MLLKIKDENQDIPAYPRMFMKRVDLSARTQNVEEKKGTQQVFLVRNVISGGNKHHLSLACATRLVSAGSPLRPEELEKAQASCQSPNSRDFEVTLDTRTHPALLDLRPVLSYHG
jgi:hypothetical protein